MSLKKHIRQGRKHQAEGSFEKAIYEFQQGLSIQNDNFECLVGLGRALFSQQRYREALAYLEKARTAAPYDTQVFHGIAECYFQLGLFTRSIEYYNKILILSASSITYFNKGLLCLNLGKFSEMGECFAKAAGEDDNELSTRSYLGFALLFTGKAAAGYKEFRYVLKLTKHINKYTVLARAGLYTEHYSETIKKRKQILQQSLKANLTAGLITLISAYDDALSPQERLRPYLPSLDVEEIIEVYYMLGIAFRTMGEYSLAHEFFIKALTEEQNNNFLFSEMMLAIYFHIAFTYQKQHKNELAIKTLEEAHSYCTVENEDILNLIKELEDKRLLTVSPSSPHSPLDARRKQAPVKLYIPPDHQKSTDRSNHSSPSSSPVSSTPSSERKDSAKNLAPETSPRSDALDSISVPKTLVTAKKSRFFQPTPLSIVLNKEERKATPSRCLVM